MRAGLVFLLSLFALAVDPRIPDAQATETPIAAYSFDEGEGAVAHDAYGENDGTVEGADWVGGKYGTALRFDSEDEALVAIPDDPSLQLTEAFTLEAWVRPQSYQFWMPVITKETEGFISYQLYAGGESLGAAEGYVSPEGTQYDGVVAPEQLPLRTWTHLALTCDGEELRLYENGELVDSAEECEMQSSTGDLLIGGNEVFGEYLNGLIDEVRLYDRALSSEEIEDDMATAIETAPSQDPIAAYSFDEGEGETATDAYGDHDGTIEGAEWVGGKYGTALHFDNEDEAAVTIPHSPELDLSGSFTLQAWVRPDHSQYWLPALAKQTEGFVGYTLYGAGEGQGTPEGYVANRDWEFSETQGEAIPPRAWSHLTLTCDGEDLRLYVDGELADTGGPCSPQPSEGPLQIGANEVFGEWFNGTIDEVRIYDRALGIEEIEGDLLEGVEAEYHQYPIAAYSFDEGEGETAHDTFGENDGAIDGAEWVAEGKFGKALRFDREAEDSVDVPSSPALALPDEFTLMAWVKPEDNEYWMPAVARETPTFDGQALYSAGEVASTPQGLVAERDWESSEALAEEALPLGEWSHLALTSDGEDLKLYVDGELVDTVPARSANPSPGPLRIGSNARWEEYFEGVIDEVRVYDRALWPLEVQENGEVGVGPLVNVTPPQIDESAEETIALTSSPGKWLGRAPVTFAYQWERCEEEECSDISGATGSTYTPIQMDLGSTLRLEVKATNFLGSHSAFSSETSTVEESSPRFETAVTITGSRIVGSTLTADISGLKGSEPLELDYEWERCVEYCQGLEEEDGTYILQAEDAASQLRVRVTAENNAGKATERTVTTGYISPIEAEGKPMLAKPPLLRGLHSLGSELGTTVGEWIGAGSISTAIQWERCGESLESCEEIAGATGEVYELESADLGFRIRSQVTAVNSQGSTEVMSSFTPRILPSNYSIFVLEPGVSLENVLKDIETAEVNLVSFDYSGKSNGIYVNRAKSTNEILADFGMKIEDEEPGARTVDSFTLWSSVSKESLGETGEKTSLRDEVPSLRFDEPESAMKTLEAIDPFVEGMASWATVDAWSPSDSEDGDIDRRLKGQLYWHATPVEIEAFFEETGSSMALEFDVKEINRSNSDPLPDPGGFKLGVCLPWEKNDFWIGTREPSRIDTNIPDSAGLYWDTAASDSCQEKDLTWGLYHPEKLAADEAYYVSVDFDGGGSGGGFSVFPSLDNESAVGDADDSLFTWGLQMLGRSCDVSPWCVGLPKVHVPTRGMGLIEEGEEFGEVDPKFAGYGPALFPGCFRFSNPVYDPVIFKAGTLPCYGFQ